MNIRFSFNAYSIIKVFITFVERISGFGEDFVFNYISQHDTFKINRCPLK